MTEEDRDPLALALALTRYVTEEDRDPKALPGYSIRLFWSGW